ncbi:MAG TPA: peptidylprolyl isomerase [Gemmatimonadaceae bacterium]
MEDTRRDEPAFLDSLLQHGHPVARARAALAVGRIGARSHIANLRQHTADPDTAVAATAWFALALLRDSGAVSVAGGALHGPRTVAVEAARLLGDVGEAGRRGIVAGLADSTLDPDVRGALLLAAARLRPAPAAAIIPWVTSSDTGVAWRAAYALARGRSAAGVRRLLSAARSPASVVREQAARGLARGVAGDSLGDSALVVLRLLALDSVPRVRVNAVRMLSSYGPRASRELGTALRDPDAGVRVTAAQSLAAVLDSSAAAWASAFTADTALAVREAVADGAAAHGVALAGVASWRTSPDWHLRAAAVSLDAHGSADEAAQRLTAWLRDRDPRVRTAAAAALAALMDSATARESVREALRASLTDRDPFVRAAALGGLSNGATATDLALGLDSYAGHVGDREPDARLAFWQLVDSALARGGATVPETLLSRLSTLQRPADPLERIAAARVPRFTAWADSAGTARPLAWYEARAEDAIRRPERTAQIRTARGIMVLTLFAWDAPLTVHNFTSLAQRHYFDGQRFHRVVPNFVIQAGDPRGDGNGGPGYAIRDEINRHRYGRGALGMALSGANTGGSQWFITHSPQPHLDGGYTIFGELRAGASVLDQIVQGDRIVRITVR